MFPLLLSYPTHRGRTGEERKGGVSFPRSSQDRRDQTSSQKHIIKPNNETTTNQQRIMTNESSYFENNISNEMKSRFISLIGPSVLANQQAVALALAHHGAGARIDASKRACAERWERRERQELAARLTARS